MKETLKTLFGVETEHLVVLLDQNGRSLPHSQTRELYGEALASRLGANSLPFNAQYGGWALPNGGRVYYDPLRQPEGDWQGSFEYATAEHTSLADLVADVQWGRSLLVEVGEQVEKSRGYRSEVYGSGVCYYSGKATGTHFNYWRQSQQPAHELAPHFASLSVVCGPGGFSTVPVPGPLFTFHPRAALIQKIRSSSSSHHRGLVDTYNQPLCKPGGRIQDINACSNHSELQLAVRAGSTALLLALSDAGKLNLDDLQLANPVAATHAFNCDAMSRQRLGTGKYCNAINLQRRLWQRVADALDDRSIELPKWSAWLIPSWDKLIRIAARTSRDTEHADADVLDWALVKAGAKAICQEWRVEWSSLATAHEGVVHAHKCNRLEWSPGRPLGSQVSRRFLERFLDSRGMEWDEFVRICDGLMPDLHAFATAFLQLGPRGIYQQMRAAGAVNFERITTDETIRLAQHPPTSTRAAVRGEFVRRHAGKAGFSASWERLYAAGKSIDIPDPFVARLNI